MRNNTLSPTDPISHITPMMAPNPKNDVISRPIALSLLMPSPTRLATILAALLLAFIALRFAQPIEDGDLFWHMLYGSQILAHHSLTVDHSQFSWMPASNQTAYVAWTGELLFLAL